MIPAIRETPCRPAIQPGCGQPPRVGASPPRARVVRSRAARTRGLGHERGATAPVSKPSARDPTAAGAIARL